MKAPRYTFLVTIEQNRPEEERNFGSADGWASILKYYINKGLERREALNVANVTVKHYATKRKAGK